MIVRLSCLAATLSVVLSLPRASGASEPGAGGTNAAAAKEPAPKNAREFYNAGTRRLKEGKLRDAEVLLQGSLAKQDAALQPPALYNLGHVRFEQGTEELKRSQSSRPSVERLNSAQIRGSRAIDAIEAAMRDHEMQKMVAAYLNGRGVRKELRSATQAVQRALEQHGSALRKWQRALGDFRSAAELNSRETNAVQNAQQVERSIARLVDSLREMQQSSDAMGRQEKELGEMLKKLRGMIPDSMMPPGADGEDGDEPDGEPPRLPGPEHEEGPGKEGNEMRLTLEQAGALLEAFDQGENRRLPMALGPQTPPADPNARNW